MVWVLRMHQFVYYKLMPAEFPTLKNDIETLQAMLQAEFEGLSAKLLKRPTVDEQGRETWMEVYDFPEAISEAFNAALRESLYKLEFKLDRADEIFVAH